MALRDKIAEAARPFLDQGEQVQAAFPAQTASQWLALAGWFPFVMTNRYRCIIATDRRILVLEAGKMNWAKPTAVIRALPRSTRIGPASGLWYRTANLGEDLRISKRFFGEIEAADAHAG
ncbi:MAG: hypothetical protein H6Q11_1348 [Acidobacteria bacterium]|nr:hypothetical protein [Acidobacteriota bacterium]